MQRRTTLWRRTTLAYFPVDELDVLELRVRVQVGSMMSAARLVEQGISHREVVAAKVVYQFSLVTIKHHGSMQIVLRCGSPLLAWSQRKNV